MGIRHSSWKREHAIVYPTVDCAIFKGDPGIFGSIYLARKENEKGWRFVGGFVDPGDSSLEEAAEREAKEETGTKCKVLHYVASSKIDDPRYSEYDDKIVTTFFCMTVDDTREPVAMDDIKEIRIFKFDRLSPEMFIEPHRELFKKLNSFFIKEVGVGSTLSNGNHLQ